MYVGKGKLVTRCSRYVYGFLMYVRPNGEPVQKLDCLQYLAGVACGCGWRMHAKGMWYTE